MVPSVRDDPSKRLVIHFTARGDRSGLTIEPCDLGTTECTVADTGVSCCGRLACSVCGVSGATLWMDHDDVGCSRHITCRHCGHSWSMQDKRSQPPGA